MPPITTSKKLRLLDGGLDITSKRCRATIIDLEKLTLITAEELPLIGQFDKPVDPLIDCGTRRTGLESAGNVWHKPVGVAAARSLTLAHGVKVDVEPMQVVFLVVLFGTILRLIMGRTGRNFVRRCRKYRLIINGGLSRVVTADNDYPSNDRERSDGE